MHSRQRAVAQDAEGRGGGEEGLTIMRPSAAIKCTSSYKCNAKPLRCCWRANFLTPMLRR